MKQEILDENAVFSSDGAVIIDKHRAIFTFKKMSPTELAKSVDDIFRERGYKLEHGTTEAGKYGKGNQVMRVLFGAFVKRFCWETQIDTNSTQTRLIFTKDAKGYVGGVIGVNQVNKEYKALTDIFTDLHFHKQ